MGRIIFVDIDGVLLPNRMWAARSNVELLTVEIAERMPRLTFDPGCVGLVYRLAKLADARLVLSSNWRRSWPGDFGSLKMRLVGAGLDEGLWHAEWMLPVVSDKWQELDIWLKDHGSAVKQALVIDDRPANTASAFAGQLAQVQTIADHGFGLGEYRAGLSFFGITDRRATKGPTAELLAVARA